MNTKLERKGSKMSTFCIIISQDDKNQPHTHTHTQSKIVIQGIPYVVVVHPKLLRLSFSKKNPL